MRVKLTLDDHDLVEVADAETGEAVEHAGGTLRLPPEPLVGDRTPLLVENLAAGAGVPEHNRRSTPGLGGEHPRDLRRGEPPALAQPVGDNGDLGSRDDLSMSPGRCCEQVRELDVER